MAISPWAVASEMDEVLLETKRAARFNRWAADKSLLDHWLVPNVESSFLARGLRRRVTLGQSVSSTCYLDRASPSYETGSQRGAYLLVAAPFD